jgi:hypothetical protein
VSDAFVSALTVSLLIFGLGAWVLLGWGSIVTRLFRMKLAGAQRTFSQLWLGLALVLLVLQLVSFFAPLNWLVTGLLALGGLLAWWFNGRKDVRLSLTPRSLLLTFIYSLIVLLTAGWIAAQSMQPPTDYDTGLYHLQSIRWYNQYALVPGLGNLHGRLAFNSSFFAFAAALNLYPYFSHGYALANGFLILLLAMECWHTLIFQPSFQRGQRSLATFAASFTLPILAYVVLRLNPASPSPDTASAVLQLLIWLYFAKLLEDPWSMEGAWTRTHILFILAAMAITVKPSSVVFVALIALILVIRDWFNARHYRHLRFIFLFRLSWLPLLIFMIWAGRGYFLSGYPVYPSTVGGIQVDWAVPQAAAEREARVITLSARYGDVEELESWAWVGPWMRNLAATEERVAVAYPLTLTFLMAMAYGALRWALRTNRIRVERAYPDEPERRLPYELLLAPIVLGLIFWWFTAPDPDIVHALFWLLPVVMAHRLLTMLKEAQWGRPRLNHALTFMMVNLAILVTIAASIPQILLLPPGFAPLPTPDLTAQRLPRRLMIWTPLHDERCWDAQLPCSPYVNP